MGDYSDLQVFSYSLEEYADATPPDTFDTNPPVLSPEATIQVNIWEDRVMVSWCDSHFQFITNLRQPKPPFQLLTMVVFISPLSISTLLNYISTIFVQWFSHPMSTLQYFNLNE